MLLIGSTTCAQGKSSSFKIRRTASNKSYFPPGLPTTVKDFKNRCTVSKQMKRFHHYRLLYSIILFINYSNLHRLGRHPKNHQAYRCGQLDCHCGYKYKLCVVYSGTGTQYSLVFPEALASRETDQWTGRRKIKMDSGLLRDNLKLLHPVLSCLFLDVESAKITRGRNQSLYKIPSTLPQENLKTGFYFSS